MPDFSQLGPATPARRCWTTRFMGSKPGDDGRELFLSYTIGIEANWLGIAAEIRQKNVPVAAEIEKLVNIIKDGAVDLPARWRAAYICEQIICRIASLQEVLAEGDRRLFEAKALQMKSAEEFGKRWEAERSKTPPELSSLVAILINILDDLQWLYNKRALDRRSRFEIAKPMVRRTLITAAICVVPLIAAVLAEARGTDLLTITSKYNTVFVCGYLTIAFGALGALFSRLTTFQRRYSEIDFDEGVSNFVGRTLTLRQIVGSVGALVVLFAMQGGLVGGGLFPNFASIFVTGTADQTHQELPKLLVWAFLAGFSERLVPDFLSKTETAGAAAARPNA